MRQSLIVVLLLTGCGGAPDTAAPGPGTGGRPAPSEAPREAIPIPGGSTQHSAGELWDLQSSGEGVALVVGDASGATALRLFCPVHSGQWLVNAPLFAAIGSEERFSFGNAAQVVTLVADASGDAARGGVTGVGPVPTNLRELLSGPVSASYGAQSTGPHAAPPGELARAFAQACLEAAPASSDGPAAPSPGPRPPVAPAKVSACLQQDGEVIAANALRAIGTEPFWGARVEGRCVTYSHPENQTGTRVWTRFSGTASDGTWTGALDGKPFVMRTRRQACSDGMSDTRYPIAVSLTVGGEQRAGCASPR